MGLAALMHAEERPCPEKRLFVENSHSSIAPCNGGRVFATYKAARTEDEKRVIIQRFAEGYRLDWRKIEFNVCPGRPRHQDLESLVQRCKSVFQFIRVQGQAVISSNLSDLIKRSRKSWG